MAKVYEFLANGFEEVEALTPVDVLRRAGIEVRTVSLTGSEFVKGAHDVIIKADKVFGECKFDDADLLILPGGMPGATNLNDHQGLRNLLVEHNLRHKKIAAICLSRVYANSNDAAGPSPVVMFASTVTSSAVYSAPVRYFSNPG